MARSGYNLRLVSSGLVLGVTSTETTFLRTCLITSFLRWLPDQTAAASLAFAARLRTAVEIARIAFAGAAASVTCVNLRLWRIGRLKVHGFASVSKSKHSKVRSIFASEI
jgi:hypothetical protein